MLDLAIELAKTNPVRKNKFCSLITTKKGRVIAQGFNSYHKSHPTQAKYGRRHTNEKACFIHAEVSAIIRARGRGHTIYVARVSGDKPMMARPCPACMAAIREETGLRQIVYTISESEFGTIEVLR